jgi:tRNA A37 threonylcarbamoyladenosine biosynthesis protein TsaE
MLYHADLYRLERPATEDLGLEDVGVSDGVLVIEWPERLSHTLAGAISVRIEIVGDDAREIVWPDIS